MIEINIFKQKKFINKIINKYWKQLLLLICLLLWLLFNYISKNNNDSKKIHRKLNSSQHSSLKLLNKNNNNNNNSQSTSPILRDSHSYAPDIINDEDNDENNDEDYNNIETEIDLRMYIDKYLKFKHLIESFNSNQIINNLIISINKFNNLIISINQIIDDNSDSYREKFDKAYQNINKKNMNFELTEFKYIQKLTKIQKLLLQYIEFINTDDNINHLNNLINIRIQKFNNKVIILKKKIIKRHIVETFYPNNDSNIVTGKLCLQFIDNIKKLLSNKIDNKLIFQDDEYLLSLYNLCLTKDLNTNTDIQKQIKTIIYKLKLELEQNDKKKVLTSFRQDNDEYKGDNTDDEELERSLDNLGDNNSKVARRPSLANLEPTLSVDSSDSKDENIIKQLKAQIIYIFGDEEANKRIEKEEYFEKIKKIINLLNAVKQNNDSILYHLKNILNKDLRDGSMNNYLEAMSIINRFRKSYNEFNIKDNNSNSD